MFFFFLEVLGLRLGLKQQLPLAALVLVLIPDDLLHRDPSLLELLKVLSSLGQCCLERLVLSRQ